MITETWLHPEKPDIVAHIPDYTIYRCDSITTPGYAGVCIYVHDSIANSFKISKHSLNTPGIDNIFLNIESSGFALCVGCIYRPRPSIYDKDLCEHLTNLSNLHKHVLLAGDFNLGDIRIWPISRSPSANSPSIPYTEMLNHSNLHQLVDQPTRYRVNQEPTTPDLILTNDVNLLSELEYHPPLGKSDHLVLSAKIQFFLSSKMKSETKTCKIVRYQSINEIFFKTDWDDVMGTGDVESRWIKFNAYVTGTVEDHTFMRAVRVNSSKPWIDSHIFGMIKFKKLLWRRCVRGRQVYDFRRHRAFSNRLSSRLREAKSKFESDLATSGDKKKFFKYTRRFFNTVPSLPLVKDKDGLVADDHKCSAEILADTFSMAFTSEPGAPIPSTASPRNHSSLAFIDINPLMVGEKLRSLNVSSSPGPDGFSARLLKECSQSLSLPISKIFSVSLTSGILPKSWKSALVSPIHKKGDKQDPNNFRPISLTSILCKILERLMYDRMLSFFLEHNIIPDTQHGFIRGRSIITCLLNCLNKWTHSLDNRLPVDVVYLDFAKAFDRVPINRLLYKLEHLGIRGLILKWIESFLTDRSFVVKVGAARSEPRCVLSGVPQGSVLGPLLFLVYVSDLAVEFKSDSASFADDIKFFNCPLNNYKTLQEDLDRVVCWCDKWLIPLNPSKCRILHLGKNNPGLTYYIDGVEVVGCSSHVDLGVVISSDLSWTEHVLHITKKVKRLIYVVQNVFRGNNVAAISQIYKSYIRPILEFAGPVWHPWLTGDAALLENLQRRVTRIPFGWNRPCYQERLRMMGLSSFADRRLRGDLIVTYRALHGLFGVDMSHLYELNSNQLRGHGYKLNREVFRTRCRENFLCNRVFNHWNGLPSEIVEAVSVNAFKNKFDTWKSN